MKQAIAKWIGRRKTSPGPGGALGSACAELYAQTARIHTAAH